MKATELMIGDWVYYKYSAPQSWEPRKWQVVAFESGFIELANPGTACKPIPLTPEILEKNGWKVDDMYAKLRLEDGKWLEYYYHESRLRKYWEGVDEWQNHAVVREITFQCHCSYVHELQHALRLCGLAEFADDFKI